MRCECCGGEAGAGIRVDGLGVVCLSCWESESEGVQVDPSVRLIDADAEQSAWASLEPVTSVVVADADSDAFSGLVI